MTRLLLAALLGGVALAAVGVAPASPAPAQQNPAVGVYPEAVEFGTVAKGATAVQSFGVINGGARPSTLGGS